MNRLELALLVLVVSGVGLSLYLVYYHFDLRSGHTGWCNFGQFVNCSSVLLSGYSEFYGVPLGAFGAGWFLVALLILLSGRVRQIPRLVSDNRGLFLALWCVAMLPFVFYLVFAELAVLKAVCVLCSATHALIASVLVLSVLAYRRRM